MAGPSQPIYTRSDVAKFRSHNDDERGLYSHGRASVSSFTSFSDADAYSEMATDEIFAGPVSESIPTSVSAFAHRRSRDSTATESSFRFFRDENVDDDTLNDASSVAVSDMDGSIPGRVLSQRSHSLKSLSTRQSRQESPFDPLLPRSSVIDLEGGSDLRLTSQKVYLEEEDLTVVIAGFVTSTARLLAYYALCTASFGLAFLLFRWMPTWRIGLIGRPTALGECDWVVIENQWSEVSVIDIERRQYGNSLSTVFGQASRKTFNEDEEGDPEMPVIRFFDYRYIRFIFHPRVFRFVINNSWKDPEWSTAKAVRVGIDSGLKDDRLHIFGQNVIDIEEKSVKQLLLEEALHPFYIFQVFSVILWSADSYYYYAACIFLISLASVSSTVVSTKQNMRRLREMSRYVCNIRVLRSGFWRYVPSSDLVPGDVYEVSDPALSVFPCDSVLLTGDCIVNESMLTGESVPVSKIPVTDESLSLLKLSASTIFPEVAKHFLFCGTKIVRVRRPEADEEEAVALAMVVRTGFNTTKGALVRSMLFPKPTGFKFYQDSFRYIGVMAIIAVCGFAVSAINFVRLGLPVSEILLRAGDLITIVVPPALPATLTIGANFALSRLRKHSIFCISPSRVNVGGKLDLICFDKTGTLTEDGLDVLGVRIVDLSKRNFEDLECNAVKLTMATGSNDASDFSLKNACLYAMATCHSLKMVDDELVGDPLDLKMFQFTKWSFDESGGTRRKTRRSTNESNNGQEVSKNLSPPIARPPNDSGNEDELEIGIIRSFDFVSHLRRMSVVTKKIRGHSMQVYVKGAPEIMPDICNQSSFPSDYEDLLSYYTHNGFRVIACATKTYESMNWAKAQKMTREEVESDLRFMGFIIFENKLKPTTKKVMTELSNAGLRLVMCTGDNVLTALSVARECSLIEPLSHVFVPRFEEGNATLPDSKLVWEGVDNRFFTLNAKTLMPNPPPRDVDVSYPPEMIKLANYSMAVTGDIFRWIVDYGNEEMLQRVLIKGQIFARMSPDEKHELVEKLQSLDYTVGFCGDGANDCGALKAADVGISLSEAEASVAAPFTSRVFDISCVPQVIREGRAALVTSFSCFKYMSIYSAIQFVTVSILYSTGSNLGDFQFLLIDLFLILPIAILMGWAGPYPVLCRKPPTANLVSRKVLVPLLCHIFLCAVTQFLVYFLVRAQTWYEPPTGKSEILNSDVTSLFLFSCYQYILAGIMLCVGRPYRKPIVRNVPFVCAILLALVFNTYLLVHPAQWTSKVLQLTYLSSDFKIWMVLIACIHFALGYSGEQFVFLRLAKALGKLRKKFRNGKRKQRKQFKVIEEEMRY